MFIVPGQYSEILHTLFRRGANGRLAFGNAESVLPVSSPEVLADWLQFEDYIMEGHVRYGLRARPHAQGLLLEIRLNGSGRDGFVAQFVADYVRWAGLVPEDLKRA